jgi:hypothetical protein
MPGAHRHHRAGLPQSWHNWRIAKAYPFPHYHGHVVFIQMKTPVFHSFHPSTQAAPKPPRA